MKPLRHILVTAAALFLMLGVPFLRSDTFAAMTGGDDAVTSASVAVDAPSGEFVVMINDAAHPNKDNLSVWKDFFSGEEISFIFEDISCTVPRGDAGALQLADSFRSRLPENQMKVGEENVILMLSKADHGKFDVIIMSKETAESFGAQSVEEQGNVTVITVRSTEEGEP